MKNTTNNPRVNFNGMHFSSDFIKLAVNSSASHIMQKKIDTLKQFQSRINKEFPDYDIYVSLKNDSPEETSKCITRVTVKKPGSLLGSKEISCTAGVKKLSGIEKTIPTSSSIFPTRRKFIKNVFDMCDVRAHITIAIEKCIRGIKVKEGK